jgi:hypothetical protein
MLTISSSPIHAQVKAEAKMSTQRMKKRWV